MSEISASGKIPRIAILIAAGMMLLTLGAALLGRNANVGTVRTPVAAVVQSRDLIFADRADGSIVITQAGNGPVVDVLAPGTNGFIRGVMRGLARDRRARGISPDVAFQLVRRSDGLLSLLDPATGGHIELDAFGPTNLEAFAHLLKTDTAKLQETKP